MSEGDLNEPNVGNESANSVADKVRSKQQGFHSPEATVTPAAAIELIVSPLSQEPAIRFAQMVELSEGEGIITYYPKEVDFDIGDILYLRERNSGENGIIVQAIEKETASYPQADSKALFRLMASVRAHQIKRSHNEPPETIDEFLNLRFRVRNAMINGQWSEHEGRVVTRNVDIFRISPPLVMENIVVSEPGFNLNLGDYKNEELKVFGGGFEKVNLITGMKGGGKSHIAKGIISENLKLNMSAVVFDINNEYDRVSDNAFCLRPAESLKFRLDYIESETFLRLINRLSSFSERAKPIAEAEIPRLIEKRTKSNHKPDIPYLIAASNQVFPGTSEPVRNMRAAYERSLTTVQSYDLIMSEKEATEEDEYIREDRTGYKANLDGQKAKPKIVSLRSAFNDMTKENPQALTFQIGGLHSNLQKIVVDLVIDHLKESCKKQAQMYDENPEQIPCYPSVFFEEAHMYMEDRNINELVPIIRHIGINVFFITNTPGALPDSVFRLIDSLIMTRLINRKDIDRLADCGLTDKETIVGFAQNLRDRHALFLSVKNGATRNFPLVFKVRDFGLPTSGQTRSQWEAMRKVRQLNKE
jgi:uncharacterized protein DUF87